MKYDNYNCRLMFNYNMEQLTFETLILIFLNEKSYFNPETLT